MLERLIFDVRRNATGRLRGRDSLWCIAADKELIYARHIATYSTQTHPYGTLICSRHICTRTTQLRPYEKLTYEDQFPSTRKDHIQMTHLHPFIPPITTVPAETDAETAYEHADDTAGNAADPAKNAAGRASYQESDTEENITITAKGAK